MTGRSSRRQRALVAAAVMLALLYGLSYAVHRLFWIPWRDLKMNERSAGKILSDRQDAFQRQALVQAVRASMMNMYRQTETDEHVQSDLLRLAQDVLASEHVRMVEIKPVPVRQNQNVKDIALSMTWEGKLVDVMRALYELEINHNGIQIQEFRFSHTGTEQTDVRCCLRAARIYFQP